MTEVIISTELDDDSPLLDLAAEEAVVGVALARPGLLDVIGAVSDADFAYPRLAACWRMCAMMREKGAAPSALTIGSFLQRGEAAAGQENSDAASYLNDLALQAPTTEHEARACAERVRDLSARRRLAWIHQAALGDAAAPQPDETPAELVARAIEALQSAVPPIKPSRGLNDVAAAILKRAFDPKTAAADALWFGVKELDERTGGFMPGEFIVPAGRPGMGKSLLANRLIRTAAEAGVGVLAFELEMSDEETAARLVADMVRDAGHEVWYSTIRRGAVARFHADALADCAEDLTRWPLVIDHRPGLTTDQIRQRAREEKRQFEAAGRRLGLIVVDHIGLVRASTDRRGNKVAEMTDVSNAMKEMAKEIGCVVVGVSQLSRAVEGRDDKRPVLSDLRESGSIEQDADTVMLLYREAYYLKHKEATMDPGDYRVEMDACRHTLEVNCAKLRGGEPGVDLVDVDVATGSIRERGRWS